MTYKVTVNKGDLNWAEFSGPKNNFDWAGLLPTKDTYSGPPKRGEHRSGLFWAFIYLNSAETNYFAFFGFFLLDYYFL